MRTNYEQTIDKYVKYVYYLLMFKNKLVQNYIIIRCDIVCSQDQYDNTTYLKDDEKGGFLV